MAVEGTAFHAEGEQNNLPHVGEDEELFVAHRIKAGILTLALKAFLSHLGFTQFPNSVTYNLGFLFYFTAFRSGVGVSGGSLGRITPPLDTCLES